MDGGSVRLTMARSNLVLADGANAKNFGENFWLWDWAFGTLTAAASKKRI